MEERKYEVLFHSHAYQRMEERGISQKDVLHVLEHGIPIEEYPEDLPYLSKLRLGMVNGGPVHVVVTEAPEEPVQLIITAYKPDLKRWRQGFRKRRK